MGDSQNGRRCFTSENQPWAGPARPWAAPAQSPFQSKVAAEAAKILSSYEGAHSIAGYDDRWRGRELELEFSSSRGHRHNWDGSTSWKWGPSDPPPASSARKQSGHGGAKTRSSGENHENGGRVIFVFPTEQEQSAKVVGSLAARREAILGQDEVVHVLKPKVPTFADVATQCPETQSQSTQTDIIGTEWSDADEDQPLLTFGHPLRYERDTFVAAPLGSPRAASPRRHNAVSSRNGRHAPTHKQSRLFHHSSTYHAPSPSGPRHGTPASPAWARSPRVRRTSHSPSPRITIVREAGAQKSGDTQSHFNSTQSAAGNPQRQSSRSSSSRNPSTHSTGTGVQTQDGTTNAGVMTVPRQRHESALTTQDLQVSTAPSAQRHNRDNSTSGQREKVTNGAERSFQHSPTRRINKSRSHSSMRSATRAGATSLATSGRRSQEVQSSNPVGSSSPAMYPTFVGKGSHQPSPRKSSAERRSGGLYRIRRYDTESTYGGKAEAEYAASNGADELNRARQLALQDGSDTSSGLGGLLNAHHQVNVAKGKPTRYANRDPHFSRYLRDGHTLGPGKHQWTFGLREYDTPRPTEEYLREAEERLGRRFSGDARVFGTFASSGQAANASPSTRPANNMPNRTPHSHSYETSLQYGSSESTRTTPDLSESIEGSSRNASRLSADSRSSVSQVEQRNSTKSRELAVAKKQPLAHAAQPQSPKQPQAEPASLSWSPPPSRQSASHGAPHQSSHQLRAVADFGTFGDISFPTPQRIDRSRSSKTSTHSQSLYSTTAAASSRTSPPKKRLSDVVAHGFRVI
eukprot:INCI3033.1.p1 GENE.INCI3033.1~~INCI3033.1.p1  ORF type:complete len:859 (-),score=94.49 INCI3033.1:102-2510(-)